MPVPPNSLEIGVQGCRPRVFKGWPGKVGSRNHHLRNNKSLFTDPALIKASLSFVRRSHGVISSRRRGCPSELIRGVNGLALRRQEEAVVLKTFSSIRHQSGTYLVAACADRILDKDGGWQLIITGLWRMWGFS